MTLAFSALASIPSWVLNPNVSDGLAAVDCVVFSGNISIDAKLASSNARLALAQQISTKVEAIDETYDSRVAHGDQTNISSRFSSASKQITKQTIAGSKILKSDIVNISGKDYFCSMAVLNKSTTDKLFNSIVTNANVNLDQDLKSEFKQTFTAQPKTTQAEQLKSLTDES